MSKLNFPAVVAKSPSESLVMLGVDEGAILEYNPASGMYVVNTGSEDVGPEDQYSYFAKTVGFSKGIIDALLEADIVEELTPTEDVSDEAVDPSDEDEKITEWDKANLTMVCGRCGTEEKVTEAIGGITLFMPTTSKAETRLVCNKCGNRMSFIYRNGVMFTEEERIEFEISRKKHAAEQAKQKAEQELEALSKVEIKEPSDESQEKSE